MAPLSKSLQVEDVRQKSGRGCDASNVWDEEGEGEFSDDEKEREAKRGKKKGKGKEGAKGGKGGKGGGGKRFDNPTEEERGKWQKQYYALAQQQQQQQPPQYGYTQQGYPQEAYHQQGCPQQGYPQQGYPQQGYAHYPPQTYPSNAYPPQPLMPPPPQLHQSLPPSYAYPNQAPNNTSYGQPYGGPTAQSQQGYGVPYAKQGGEKKPKT